MLDREKHESSKSVGKRDRFEARKYQIYLRRSDLKVCLLSVRMQEWAYQCSLSKDFIFTGLKEGQSSLFFMLALRPFAEHFS